MEIGKLAKHNSGGLLSEDMIIEIFLWLPSNSLVRFKRLSKRWYFLISHKDSNFRFNYLSTLSTRSRNRIIVGDDDDDFHPIMLGFFCQCLAHWRSPARELQFLPTKKYNIRQGEGNKMDLFSCLDKWRDKFLSCQEIFIAASSNGFLLCSLQSDDPVTYYIVNPVTMEWVALPKLRAALPTPNRSLSHAVGFVCKGYYPTLDLVEYTIVIVSLRQGLLINPELLFKFFSSGDNQWREYRYSCPALARFTMTRHYNPVIVRTATNSDDQGGGIVVYFLVMVMPTMATAIVVFDLNRGDNLLQMIETPGPEMSVYGCDDYMREFDDGVIHYVRICCSTDFEFWVLKTESRDWCLKHKASLKMMMKGFLWTEEDVHGLARPHYIHGFHPMNPNLIFLTLYSRMVCYNVQTEELELVYDLSQQNMLDSYYQYVYQWPCWPPLF